MPSAAENPESSEFRNLQGSVLCRNCCFLSPVLSGSSNKGPDCLPAADSQPSLP